MTWSLCIRLQPSGLAWAERNMSNTSVWMPPAHFLALRRLGHSLCFIHSLDATKPPVCLARVGSGSYSLTDVTEAFKFLQDHLYYQLDKDDSIFKLLERVIVVLYDNASNVINVNEARKKISPNSNRTLENIPPTQVNWVRNIWSEIQAFDLFYCS